MLHKLFNNLEQCRLNQTLDDWMGAAVKQRQSKGGAVPVKGRSSASHREEQCQSKGGAVPVTGRSSASQREAQCQSTGNTVPAQQGCGKLTAGV